MPPDHPPLAPGEDLVEANARWTTSSTPSARTTRTCATPFGTAGTSSTPSDTAGPSNLYLLLRRGEDQENRDNPSSRRREEVEPSRALTGRSTSSLADMDRRRIEVNVILQLVFNSLRRYRWKLNPEKCVYGVPAGKLLGFIVSHRGIEANPDKIEVIMKMEAPRSQKKVQRLTGCMAALSRFISRLGEKGLPFYKLLKKVDKFQWTSEAQEALDALKKILTTPPVLKPPRRATSTQPAKDLLLYISCTTHVVSTALVVERVEEGHAYPVQHLVYFISEVLGPSKKKYPQVQKLLYTVLLTARKLRHYFDDHKVIVVTRFPIGDILHNKEAIGRIAKWACELGSHDIEFRPCTAIKTQALVDFVSEWTEQQVPDNPETTEVWRMYFDGSLKLQGAGAGILFTAPGGEHLKYALQLLFPASNNAAEYEALIHGLNI
jgi:hypothetical protein